MTTWCDDSFTSSENKRHCHLHKCPHCIYGVIISQWITRMWLKTGGIHMIGDKHAALSILVGLVVEIFWFVSRQLINCPLSLYILTFCAWILFFLSQAIEISMMFFRIARLDTAEAFIYADILVEILFCLHNGVYLLFCNEVTTHRNQNCIVQKNYKDSNEGGRSRALMFTHGSLERSCG